MNKTAKRFLSFALATTVVAGAPVAAYAADDNTEEAAIEETAEETTSYIVKEGDTLGKIAERYYGNAAYYVPLAKYNHIQNPALIFVGQIITVPKNLAYNYQDNTAVIIPTEEVKTYTVKRGEVLDKIVEALYGSNERRLVNQFATFLGLPDPNQIYEGQVFIVPDIEVLKQIEPNDYTAEYNRMAWKLNHPRPWYQCGVVNPNNGWLPGYPIVIPNDQYIPCPPPAPCMPEEPGPCRKLTP